MQRVKRYLSAEIFALTHQREATMVSGILCTPLSFGLLFYHQLQAGRFSTYLFLAVLAAGFAYQWGCQRLRR